MATPVSCENRARSGNATPHAPRETRHTLLATDLLRVERLSVHGLTRRPTPPVHSPELQLVLPVLGAFTFHCGSSRELIDPNQALVIEPDNVSSDSHPVGGDVHLLLITPREPLLNVLEGAGSRTGRPAGTQPLQPQLQPLLAALWQQPRTALPEAGLEVEELSLTITRRLLAAARPAQRRRRDGSLVDAARELLASTDERLSLLELSRRLGTTPAHLTTAFRSRVGLSLAAYHRRLRLARALIELPRSDDLARLALDLGFSSHAHFSTAFKRLFGEPPSALRRRLSRTELRTLLERVQHHESF